ncbi:MAG: hypothetical protein C0503_05540 [Gemmatimonas sp.]|nr:hypothetical protein [Gemmatimonas sp.]
MRVRADPRTGGEGERGARREGARARRGARRRGRRGAGGAAGRSGRRRGRRGRSGRRRRGGGGDVAHRSARVGGRQLDLARRLGRITAAASRGGDNRQREHGVPNRIPKHMPSPEDGVLSNRTISRRDTLASIAET